MVSSSGKMDNVKITNIVSARGDAMAIQLFPSNKVTIGSNIHIEDIHAGAALDTNAVSALKPSNFLPNKVPRACAITVWTYTDEDNDYTENVVTFEDKEAVNAKCLTMHTYCRFVVWLSFDWLPCCGRILTLQPIKVLFRECGGNMVWLNVLGFSDSEFDGEALENVADCDDTTMVGPEAQSMNNGEIYGKYIRPLSSTHEKLFAIIEQHPEPDFFPPRAFPKMHGHPAKGGYLGLTLWCALFLAAAVMLLAVAFYRNRSPMEQWNKALEKGSERQPLITGHWRTAIMSSTEWRRYNNIECERHVINRF